VDPALAAPLGATDQEVRRAMPGDQLIPDAASTTRAITITAPPEQVWPWLVQLGYGRAGWYSYDWIDNDGHPSADRAALRLSGSACITTGPWPVVHGSDDPGGTTAASGSLP
jgi:hypothetical protein